MYSPHKRIAALREVRAAGLTSVGVISPLLPLDDVRRFTVTMEEACDQVILDHFLIGDGSEHGLRTHRSGFPQMLIRQIQPSLCDARLPLHCITGVETSA